jgi:probable phosphoglycerate mutase
MTPTPLGGEPNVFDYAHYSYLVDGPDRTELILVRHGQQLAHAPAGPFAAAIDPPLSEVGEQQVKLLGERFAEQDIDAVYSSRLLRAHATAEAVAGEHGLTPIVVDDLREVEVFRDLPPGATVLDVLGEVSMHGVRERMLFEKRWDVYPASESSADFRRRVVNAIEGIAALNTGRRVVVACHGGVINAYLAHHLGIHADMWFRPQHTSLNVMFAAANGIRAVRTIGDVHHLRDHAELVTF